MSRSRRMIVAGGRDHQIEDFTLLRNVWLGYEVTEMVTGRDRGIDADAHEWARSHSLKTRKFMADWDALGPGVAPVRNAAMAQYAAAGTERGICVLYPGAPGTASMKREAEKAGLLVIHAGQTIDPK